MAITGEEGADGSNDCSDDGPKCVAVHIRLLARGISYDLPKARSMLHAPDPTLAIYRKMKQYSTASSPLFRMGQKPRG